MNDLFYGISRSLIRFSRALEVERPRSGAYDENGKWQDHGVDKITVMASVQSTSDEDLMKLDEGRRLRGSITIYSTSLLHSASVEAGSQPDIVVWDNLRYLVENVKDRMLDGHYCKAVATRQDS
jgi:hypothetical protein